jgi:ArsR family transcriptional regulator
MVTPITATLANSASAVTGNGVDAAVVFKALGEQTRVRIAMLLVGQELCVCDLTEILRLPQSTISRHMTQLRQSKLVIDRRVGTWIHYRLADDKVAREISRLLENSFREMQPYKGDRERLAAHAVKSGCAPAKMKKKSRSRKSATA